MTPHRRSTGVDPGVVIEVDYPDVRSNYPTSVDHMIFTSDAGRIPVQIRADVDTDVIYVTPSQLLTPGRYGLDMRTEGSARHGGMTWFHVGGEPRAQLWAHYDVDQFIVAFTEPVDDFIAEGSIIVEGHDLTPSRRPVDLVLDDRVRSFTLVPAPDPESIIRVNVGGGIFAARGPEIATSELLPGYPLESLRNLILGRTVCY